MPLKPSPATIGYYARFNNLDMEDIRLDPELGPLLGPDESEFVNGWATADHNIRAQRMIGLKEQLKSLTK